MEFTNNKIIDSLLALQLLTGISKELYEKYLLESGFSGKYAPEKINGLEIAGTHKSFPCLVLGQEVLHAQRAVGEDFLKDIAGILRGGGEDFADETRTHRIYIILPTYCVGLLDEKWQIENFDFRLLTYNFATIRDHLLQFDEIKTVQVDSPIVDFAAPPIPNRTTVPFYEPGNRVATLSDGKSRRVHLSVEGDLFIKGKKGDPNFPTDLKNEAAIAKLIELGLTDNDVVGLSVTTQMAGFGSFKVAVDDCDGSVVKIDFLEKDLVGYQGALEKAWRLLHARDIVWNDFFETDSVVEYRVGAERREQDACPFCGSTDIAAGEIKREDTAHIFQRMNCRGCEKHWHDKFKLTGWTQRLK